MKFRWNVYDREKVERQHDAYVKANAPATAAWKQNNAHLMKWHRWFAWYPVAINDMKDDYRWLETMERRAIPWQVSPGIFKWEYRDYRS